jgi:flagellar basal-body rod protein FlgC
MKKFLKIFIIVIIVVAPFTSQAGSLKDAMMISSYGIKAQGERMKVVAENIANSENTGSNPSEAPYQRKVIYFENKRDSEKGINALKVRKVGRDVSQGTLVYRPDHPAANPEGYVRLPNVDRTLESMDLREAQRSYEANISVIETTKKMMDRTLDLMR